jgi:lysophospholipase L1-like esterase
MSNAPTNPARLRFPIPLGTQTFGCAYQFTGDDPRVESARRIASMGSNVVKFSLRHEPRPGEKSVERESQSLTQLCSEPSPLRDLLDMPFARTLLWAHGTTSGDWRRPATTAQLSNAYTELRDCAEHLLRTYNGSGRSFYLGNWEGDWLLTPPPGDVDPSSEMVVSMIERLRQRQRAVDDAIAAVPHDDVNVYHYLEINRVQDAMSGERKRMVSHVLPHVAVDLVSYSAYDSTNAEAPRLLSAALDYIERQHVPTPRAVEHFGKRVFIGEYGFPALKHGDALQEERSREVMKIAIHWGCPLVLYWEMYNNEIDEQGRQRGYWLVDDQNRTTSAFTTHERYCAWAREQLEKSPEIDPAAFRKASVATLDRIGNDLYAERGRQLEPARVVDASLLDRGDLARLHNVMRKARQGGSIVIGGIGGSITQGAGATRESFRYLDLVTQWWRDAFPGCEVKLINAGIGATSSIYGALRLQRDLLSANPDFVVIDYGVNDGPTDTFAATYEGCVRQILAHASDPALLAVFFMHRGGRNAEETHGRIAAHYRLPAVSYRDALWPEVRDDRLVWESICHDDVHPNDRGHAAAAQFITAQLAHASATLPDAAQPLAPLPAPLYSDTWQRTELNESASLVPRRNEGWRFDEQARAWIATEPGSIIEFDILGMPAVLMWYRLRSNMGMARVFIDDINVGEPLDAWFPGTWGGYRESTMLQSSHKPGPRRLAVRLLPERNPESSGHEFRVLGVGSCTAT